MAGRGAARRADRRRSASGAARDARAAGHGRGGGAATAGRPGGDPLRARHETLELLATAALPGLPPLSGGMVGFVAYDLVRRLERLPELAVDDLRPPRMAL